MLDKLAGRRNQSMQADYLAKKIKEVADTNVTILDENTTVAEAVKIMHEKDISSVLVNKKGSKDLAGIMTERDVLYKVVAENKGPFKVQLKDVMSSPVLTIDESSTVREAVAIMRQKRIRRLPVLGKDGIVGIVTLRSVVGNIPSQSVELVEVDTSKISCPYCGSKFENKEDLSKHIDRLHIGSGLLEGDLRKSDFL